MSEETKPACSMLNGVPYACASCAMERDSHESDINRLKNLLASERELNHRLVQAFEQASRDIHQGLRKALDGGR